MLAGLRRLIPRLFGLVLVATTVSAAGLESPGRYDVDFWGEAEGLPHSRVNAVVQTRDGYLWLGAENGLIRFDGATFTPFTMESGALRDNEVRALLEDREGSLWIGTYGGGVTVFRRGHFTTYSTANGLPDDVVTRLDMDSDGHVWVATPSGVSLFANGRFDRLARADGRPMDDVTGICAQSPFGGLVATRSQLYRLRNGKLEPLDEFINHGDGEVQRALYSADGSLWLGFGNGLVKRWKNGHITEFRWRRQDRPTQVTMLAEAPKGNIWVAAEGELLHLHDDRFVAVPMNKPREGLGTIYSLCIDREQNVWLGLQSNGLARLRNKPLRVLSADNADMAESIRSIFEDHQGNLWIGMLGSLARYREGHATLISQEGGRPIRNIKSIAEASDSRLWIASDNDVLVLEGGTLSRLPAWKPIAPVQVVFRDRNNHMWVGTDGAGLFRYDGQRFENFRTADGLSGDRIRALHEDRQGALWIGTAGRGVSRYQDGKITLVNPADAATPSRVAAIYEDSDGTLWFACRNGLTRFANGRFFTYTSRSGLLADSLYNMLDDGQGNFWFASQQGIFRVSKADLRGYAEGSVRRVTSVGYGLKDGMPTRSCSSGSQPTAWKTSGGKLLFGSMKGVVVVDPRSVFTTSVAPPVYIERTLLNRRECKPDANCAAPPGGGEAEIHYTALSFQSPEKLRFKYTLEGFDRDWVDAGERRFAYYANLSPGTYRFRVIAGGVDSQWNQEGASYSFECRPHFYQTRIFLACVILATLLLALLGMHLRMASLRARYGAVLEERNRIAQDIHDTFAQNLAGIALQLDSVTMQLAEVPAGLRKSLDQACSLTRYSLAEARRTITELRSDKLERRLLSVALPEMTTRLTAGSGLRTQVRIEGPPRMLNPVTETNLLRIFQEAVANAVKHAQATSIEIELRFRPDGLMLRIKDDGKGFDPRLAVPLTVGHYGLLGMHERTGRIGGHFDLRSSPGTGTEVVVEVPLSAKEEVHE